MPYCPTCTRHDGVRRLCEPCKAILSAEPPPSWTDYPTRSLATTQTVVWNSRHEDANIKHRQSLSPCGQWMARWYHRDDRRLELNVHRVVRPEVGLSVVSETAHLVLTRNGYYIEMNTFACHWFNHDSLGSVLLYNPQHGVLAVVDPETKITLASQAKIRDYFIFELLTTTDPYRMLVCGWVWHPLLSGRLFDLRLLLAQNDKYVMPIVYDEWSTLHGKMHVNGMFVYGLSEQTQWNAESDDSDESESEDSKTSDLDDQEDPAWTDEPFPPVLDTLYSWDRVQSDRRLCVNNLVLQVVKPDGTIEPKPREGGDARGDPPVGSQEELARVDRQVIPHLVPHN